MSVDSEITKRSQREARDLLRNIEQIVQDLSTQMARKVVLPMNDTEMFLIARSIMKVIGTKCHMPEREKVADAIALHIAKRIESEIVYTKTSV